MDEDTTNLLNIRYYCHMSQGRQIAIAEKGFDK